MKKNLNFVLLSMLASNLQASTFQGRLMSSLRGDGGASQPQSAQADYAEQDYSHNSILSSGKDIPTDIGINTEEFGNEARLLKYLGEDPYDYIEIFGKNLIGQYNALRSTVKSITGWTWKLSDIVGKSQYDINVEKKVRANNAVKDYIADFGDKAFICISNDIEAFTHKMRASKDPKFQQQLAFLLDSAKQARAELFKQEVERVYQEYRPSVKGGSLKRALDDAESALRLAENKDEKELYGEVVKRLQKIKQEVSNLKNRNDDSLRDALNGARRLSGTFKTDSQQQQNQDIIAELEYQQKEEDKAQDVINAINTRVDELIKNHGSSPSEALETAQTKLDNLKNELKQLQLQKVSRESSKMKDKHLEIDREEAVIKILHDKVKIAEEEDKIVGKRIGDLLSKNDNDVQKALEEIHNKLRFSQVKNPVDVKIVNHLDRLLKDEKKLAEKFDEQKSKIKTNLNKFYNSTNALKNNPIEAMEKVQEQLDSAVNDLTDIKRERNPNRLTIKELQDSIESHKLTLIELKKQARDFELKVAKRLKELVEKHGGDKQALKFLVPAYGQTNYMNALSNFWNGTSSKEPSLENLIEKLENGVDRQVARKLAEKIKEDLANDPVEIAVARLNSASAAEVPGAVEAVLGARLSQLGLNVDNLNMNTRQQLAGMVSNTSRRTMMIMNDPRLTPAAKQQQKQAITQAMAKEMAYVLASYTSGVDAAALATGDVTVIATSKLLNTLVGTDASTSLVPMDMNYNNYNGYGQDQSHSLVARDSAYNNNYNNQNNQYNNQRQPEYGDQRQAAYNARPSVRDLAYQELGLTSGASKQDIRNAYMQLARQHHPDKGGDADMFIRVQDAYEELMRH